MNWTFSPLPLDFLGEVRAAISPRKKVFLVGGAVRDALLGRTSYDFDFSLDNGALAVARRVADCLGGAYYPLDRSRDIGRVIYKNTTGHRSILDFAGFQGSDLDSDLRNRDFTINAMAVDLNEIGKIIDPLDGAKDLKEKMLRSCSSSSISADPVRILRAFRLASDFDMRIHSETKGQLRQAIPLLVSATIDRLRDELFRILDGRRPVTALRGLDILGALDYILPELSGLKSVAPSPPHVSDVFNHTLEAVNRIDQILAVLSVPHEPEISGNWALGLVSMRLGRFREALREHLNFELVPHRSLRALIFLAVLLHDIGKPGTRSVDDLGRVHFYKHELIGSNFALERARQLHLSKRECDRVYQIVKNHMRPMLLAQSNQTLSRRSIFRFFNATGETGVEICLLSLADTLATYGPGLPQDVWTRQLDVVRSLLEAWWERPEESISPPALLDGNDLMIELGIEQGPLVGQILYSLQELQASGEIRTLQEALDHARTFLEGNIQTKNAGITGKENLSGQG